MEPMAMLQFLGKFAGAVPLLLRAMVGAAFGLSWGYGAVTGPEGFDGGKAFAAEFVTVWPPLLYAAAWTMFLGGLAILAGLFTRWAAIGILAVMVYAVFGIHWANGFAAERGGWEPAATYATLCLCLMAVGPGSLSLDRLFFGKAALNP
jgi:putative oxidoreductase